MKAVYRFLRRCDLHLPAGGEYPAVEVAAEINGRLHSEVVAFFVANLLLLWYNNHNLIDRRRNYLCHPFFPFVENTLFAGY